MVKQLQPWMQYLEWRFLADAGEKAAFGRHGWLFFRPSVRYVIERQTGAPESDAADPLPAIRSFRDQLEARGIRLLVVPVPNKENVYPGMLAKRAEGAGVVVCEQTRRLLDQLERCGIEHVDLFEVFRGARQVEGRSDPGRLYLAQDCHWSPEGARVAAGAVARRVLVGGTVNRGDHAYVERSVTVLRHGDLVQMLQVPQIERALEPERLACLQVVQSDARTPYCDAPKSEVLIRGDSFLLSYEQDEPGAAGFIAHVARELGATADRDCQRRRSLHVGPARAGTPPDSPGEQEAGDLGIRRARYSLRYRGVANRSPGSVKAPTLLMRSALPPWRGSSNMNNGPHDRLGSHTHHEVVHQWIEPCSVELLLPGVGRLRGRQRGGHQRASVQGEGNNPRFSHRPGPDSGRVLRDHPWSTWSGYG